MPEIIPPTKEDKEKLLIGIGEISRKYGIYTQTCGTDQNYEKYGIHLSGCTTAEILDEAHHVPYKRVKPKPMRKGCHCIPSRDIGAYDTCLNGCKYCYANKNPEIAKQKMKFHDKKSPLLLGNIKKTDQITESKQSSLVRKDKNEQLSFM